MSDPNRPASPSVDADEARGLVEQVFARHQALRQEAEDAGDATGVDRFDALIREDVAALKALTGDPGQAAATAARYEQLLAALDRRN